MSNNKAKRLSGINTLAYMGIEPITAPLLIVKLNNEIPTTDDRVGNQIGALWVSMDTAAGANNARIFVLTRLDGAGPSGNATWTELMSGGGGVNSFITDNGTVIPALDIVNMVGGTSVGGVATNINTFANPNLSNNLDIALNNSIFFPDTTDINNGVIGFGGSADTDRFIHNFGSANTFVGEISGNFTLTGTNLVGIGDGALVSTTSGSENTAVGSGAGSSLTSGGFNTLVGSLAGAAFDTASNVVAVGARASQLGTGSDLVVIGSSAAQLATTLGRSVIIGSDAVGTGNATASDIVIIGQEAAENLTSVSDTIAIGSGSLALCTSSGPHLAIGTGALSSVTNTATNHVAIGNSALASVTTSLRCTAVGYEAADAVVGSSDNLTAIGWHAGNAGTGLSSCTFVGANAGANSTAIRNVFIGQGVGQSGCSGAQNTGIGTEALEELTSGTNNTAVGRQALNQLTTGTEVIGIGHLAGFSLTSGIETVHIGNNAGQLLTTGSSNVIVGHNAMLNTTANSSSNVAIGWNCMADDAHSSAVGIGFNASNTGTLNTSVVIGFRANETGTGTQMGSVMIGSRAGLSQDASQDIVAIGRNTLQTGSNLNGDVAIGRLALGSISTGTPNVAIGYQALEFIATGSNNTALGTNAGVNLTLADSSNIIIGNNGTVGDNNTTRIGTHGAGAAQQNKCFIAGIRGITTGVADAIAVLIDSAHQLGTVSSSARYKDNIQDMGEESSPVMELRPVTFTYKNDEQKRTQYGLIAEEVEEVMPRLVVYDEDGLPQSVRYNDLPQLLLNELKKLEKRVSHLERVHGTCKHIC